MTDGPTLLAIAGGIGIVFYLVGFIIGWFARGHDEKHRNQESGNRKKENNDVSVNG